MKHFSFPKSARLLTSNQFRRIAKYGETLSGTYLSIQLCESKKPTPKLGLTVSRKFGSAVKRNRFKRLVREAFRLSQHNLSASLHLNIRPTKSFDQATLEALKAELLSLCSSRNAKPI